MVTSSTGSTKVRHAGMPSGSVIGVSSASWRKAPPTIRSAWVQPLPNAHRPVIRQPSPSRIARPAGAVCAGGDQVEVVEDLPGDGVLQLGGVEAGVAADHRAPPRGAVGVGELLDHEEHVADRQLGTAPRRRHRHPEGVGRLQGVDGGAGQLPVGLGLGRRRRRAGRTGLVPPPGCPPPPRSWVRSASASRAASQRSLAGTTEARARGARSPWRRGRRRGSGRSRAGTSGRG